MPGAVDRIELTRHRKRPSDGAIYGPRGTHSVPMTVDESIASMKSLLKKIKRSAYVYRVDCGGCNGCEISYSLSPLFDAERFGIKLFRHRVMRILLFTGAVTRNAIPCAACVAVRAGPENHYLLRCLR